MKAMKRGPFRQRPKPVIKFIAGHRLILKYRNSIGSSSSVALDAKVTPDGRIAEFTTTSNIIADYAIALRDRLRRGRPHVRGNVELVIHGDEGSVSVSKTSGWDAADRRAFRKYRRHEREDQARLIRETGMMNVMRSLRKEHEQVKLLAHRTVNATYTMAAPAIEIDRQYLLEMRVHKGVHTWVLKDHDRIFPIICTPDVIRATAALKKAKLKAYLNV